VSSGALRRLRNLLVVGSARVGLGRGSGRRIIALHDIRDGEEFRRRMGWLTRHFAVRPLRDLLAGPVEARSVALTFDDGYASWDELVRPVLAELNLPATFFVSSGFVGLGPEAAAIFAHQRLLRRQTLRPLTAVQLRRLAEQPGFEIGSHTVNHSDLGVMRHEAEVREEIAGDRGRLEDLTGRAVRLFAYPFGQPRHATPLARKVLEEAGFEWAFSIVPGFVEAARGRFEVGRDSLDVGDPERVWAAWLGGAYDELYRFKQRLGGVPRQRRRPHEPEDE
jgi:peptidoglycan/xylan/chitin deacetylase (PgdA/CDA1 family)